jgi:hypothetical protein
VTIFAQWVIVYSGSDLKIRDVAHIFEATLFGGKVCPLIATKMGRDILGEFFTNSSGHPDRDFSLRMPQYLPLSRFLPFSIRIVTIMTLGTWQFQ